MTSHQPSVHTPPQVRDEHKKEEAKREELERRTLESDLLNFDAHDFYDRLEKWSLRPVPQPVYRYNQISWNKKEPNMFQPIPISRAEFPSLRSLSSLASTLLALLKSAEEKGLSCPYVHQLNKETLEVTIRKCQDLQKAIERFRAGSGMVSRLLLLLHNGYIHVLSDEVKKFLSRLEAIFLICRHEEFAQDLVRLRRAVTYRTGYILGPEIDDSHALPKKKL